MEVTARRILVAGMPSSGKSTYIAALRHVLLSDETDSRLVMSKLAADERHLNALQDRWLALNTFERTREKSESWVTIHVRPRAGGQEAELVVPDLRGEVFEAPAATGFCLRTVAETLVNADGILFFTNAEKPDDALLISDFGDIDDEEIPALVADQGPAKAAVAGEAVGAAAGPTETEPPKPVETEQGRLRFQPDRMPEEAKVVEVLQFANRRPHPRRRRRLAVIVSAWDVVLESGDVRTPAQWLTDQRPMLSQFLRHNPDAWDVRIYGVSAQGGMLPRDRVRLQSLETASERIIVVGDEVPKHDPTAPIAWLISGG